MCGGLQHAGQQVDERGLARTVGANERMARALLQVQRDVVGGGDAARFARGGERVGQVIGGIVQRAVHGGANVEYFIVDGDELKRDEIAHGMTSRHPIQTSGISVLCCIVRFSMIRNTWREYFESCAFGNFAKLFLAGF